MFPKMRLSEVALYFALGIIPLFLLRRKIKKAIKWIVSSDNDRDDTQTQVQLLWSFRGDHPVGIKDDGTLYLPRRGAGPWRRHDTHTPNVYKFSTFANDKEYYLVRRNGSNRVCGKTHFFKGNDCWRQCSIHDPRNNIFLLQFCKADGDSDDGKFFIIDLTTPDDRFKLGDYTLAKTNGVFMY